jgi:cobyrinic acid a,c-diamide synthase
MGCPRIVIAGTQSGVGKTSVSLALVAALRRRGYRVQTFKVGPDFLDPSYLALASGRPCYNLDGWMAGKDYVCRLFTRATNNADIAVVEGVMGLFDGADPTTLEGSTAEIAQWLRAPVILIASAHGMGRSLAAVVKGYADFEPEVEVAGVIANQCGSERHEAWLSDSLRASSLPPLVGAIPRNAFPELTRRHLGLVTANSGNLSGPVLDTFANAFELHGSVDDVLRLARRSPSLERSPLERLTPSKPIRIGVAFDAAFHFYYQDLFDEMELRGAELIRFSPIENSSLPERLDALYIGGGYPEEHAEALSANGQMLTDIRQFAASGCPVYAECGGLIYISRSLETLDGKQYPFAGLLPVATRMLHRKKFLGYVEVTLKESSLWGSQSTTLRGHEFHYSELTGNPTVNRDWKNVYTVRRPLSGAATDEGFQCGRVLASYVHLHLASRPEAVERFITSCGGKS